jgi:hypothetical protein
MTQPTITNLLAKLDAMRGQKTFTKHRRGTQRANDFAIWRAGSSVNWECTNAEIAADTGLGATTVRDTRIRRGWKLTRDNYGGLANRPDIDRIMASPYAQANGAT